MAQTRKQRLIQALAWWESTTWGTSLTTWLRGEAVGEDEFGNRYFRSRGGKIDPALGIERRWVIYNGTVEASKIPPNWYRWMHHLSKTAPDGSEKRYAWQKPHLANQTGTANAHRPAGSILRPDPDVGVSKGYRAWTPD